MKKIGLIIQARMGSSRLPGKVMMKLGNMSLLEFLIKRLKTLGRGFKVVVATTFNEEDERIVELCERLRVDYFRGSEKDVLRRYIACAKRHNIDVVVRICADCPFVSIEGIKELIKTYNNNSMVDLVHNKYKNGYPFGTGAELVTVAALQKVAKEDTTQYGKEHVLPYILNNPEKFKIIQIKTPKNMQNCPYRLAIDYKEDLSFARKILAEIRHENKTKISSKRIIQLLNKNRLLAKLLRGEEPWMI